MKKGSTLVLAVSLLGMASAPRLAAQKSSQDASEFSQPLLYRRVDVPEQLLGRLQREGKEPVPFMGDVRIGDLTQDGRADVLVFRSVDGGMKPSFLGAFTMEGKVLWQVGQGGQQPNRPGPVAIHDIDGDGGAEIIGMFARPGTSRFWKSLENVRFQIRDVATGQIERQAAPTRVTQHGNPGPPREDPSHWNAANWVHQRILIANFQGHKSPRDFVIKLGLKLFAFDSRLNMLWHYTIPEEWQAYGRHTAYIPAVGDIDDDGKDEVTGGYYLLDDDGTALWEKELGPHMDSVAIAEWDGGQKRVIASGHGHVVSAGGDIIVKLGGSLVPHGQEVRVADLVNDKPGPEMIIRHNGHRRGVRVISNDGSQSARFKLNATANNTGMSVVYWEGQDQPALISNGGVLWSGDGRWHARFPKLPKPVKPVSPKEAPGWRMPWYHAIAGNLAGDSREEVLLYNPWDTSIFIYTPVPLRKSAFDRYNPGPRQYNPRLMD